MNTSNAAIKLPVKATLVMNFGKFDYVYKPLDERGIKMLQTVIAMSTKPDSKRQNFSKADVLKAINITSQSNISIEFIVQEINSPEVPSKPVLNQPIAFNTALPSIVNADLGFLG